MKKILYIEDNTDTASAVKIILDKAGFQTTICHSGKEGIAIAKSEEFNLFLLDIMLPDMSGWDIFSILSKKSKAKFAFLSAIPVSSERMKELLKVGISDYITKPFSKGDLIARIESILK